MAKYVCAIIVVALGLWIYYLSTSNFDEGKFFQSYTAYAHVSLLKCLLKKNVQDSYAFWRNQKPRYYLIFLCSRTPIPNCPVY